MSKTCDVFVKLPYGLVIEEGFAIAMDGKAGSHTPRLILSNGLTEDVERAPIENWLARNKKLACVRRGDIRIIDHGQDILAIDSNRKK